MATYALTEKAIVLKLEDDVAVAKTRFTPGRGSVFGCKPAPSIKLATNGVILEGTPLPTVGRQIFEEIIAVASGKRTKSELSGVGEEEFAPWIIGPVM
jgi:altronate hydrolase